jgi:hypothetical protein
VITAMGQQDPPSFQHVETLAGDWHALGPLELRRLLLEGATIVLPDSQQELDPINAPVVVVEAHDIDLTLRAKIPDLGVPLVCLCINGMPDRCMADRLSSLGCQHVFIPETHWAGLVALVAVGATPHRWPEC